MGLPIQKDSFWGKDLALQGHIWVGLSFIGNKIQGRLSPNWGLIFLNCHDSENVYSLPIFLMPVKSRCGL
jgi:hypothetical protein